MLTNRLSAGALVVEGHRQLRRIIRWGVAGEKSRGLAEASAGVSNLAVANDGAGMGESRPSFGRGKFGNGVLGIESVGTYGKGHGAAALWSGCLAPAGSQQ